MKREQVTKNNWRVYPSQIAKVKATAKNRNVSQSQIIRELIEELK